jgi:uncharacterized membrane protein
MAQEFNTKLISVAANFLEALNVPFTKKTLKQTLEANPYYPSLYSLSEVFNRYNIENKGLEVDPEQLDELPLPFMADISIQGIGGKDFVNVTQVTKDSVTYYYGKEKTISRNEFINSWRSNIVFLAEATNKSKEKDFDKNKKTVAKDNIRIYLLLLGFSLILIRGIYTYLTASNDIIAASSFFLFTFMGLAISVLFLIYEVDKSNTFVKNICTGDAKTNCDAVLGSKAATLFGIISWGEVGFFYFFSIALFLLIPGIPFVEKIPYISYISILSAMYIPFSIFYQYKVVKEWCRLCLFVQAVLFLNLCWVLQFGYFAINPSCSNLILFITCAVFPILLWYTLKPIIIKAKDADKFLAAYKRLYSRQDVFNLTLADQEEALNGWQNLGGIEKGNPNAKNIILKVCSPSCGHCNKAHGIFNELLQANDNLKVITIYGISNDERDDDLRLPVKHFLALAEQENKKSVEEAMDYWYLNNNREYYSLKEKFPVSDELLEKQRVKIKAMRVWYDAAEIEYTPTVFVNGKKLPSTFNLSDLKGVF